jgi:hypothetical protein
VRGCLVIVKKERSLKYIGAQYTMYSVTRLSGGTERSNGSRLTNLPGHKTTPSSTSASCSVNCAPAM